MPDTKDMSTKLNAEQEAAVNYIDGPLLVVAGPGTGKTQLLSARAANILQKTDSKPENILALTFTEKAAQNMKQRMLNMIGPEARKIVVKTFHGLGVELINAYPEYFWQAARLKPAPEAVELEIIEEVLQTRSLDDPYALKFMGTFTMTARARSQIAQAKKAGLTPDKLAAVAALNQAQLHVLQKEWGELLSKRMSKKLFAEYQELADSIEVTQSKDLAPIQPITEVLQVSLERALAHAQEEDSTKPLTEWKNDWTRTEQGQRVWSDIQRSERMQALAEVYRQFQKQMFSRGYYDFDDMILEVITQLEQQPDFRADVQERFTHIMIDEFQDTNDAQFRLSYLIASHPAQAGRPNIMAVGDDDQAIYRFQGAELSNIDNFTQSFTDTHEIALTKNYRSHQSVIGAAQATASLIEHRLVDIRPGLNKELTQAADVGSGVIVHQRYVSEAEQLAEVAKQAYEVFNKGKRVAVLSRSHAPLEELAGLLHAAGAPVRYTKRNDILSLPSIEIFTRIAECTVAINNFNKELVNERLVDILGHPMFSISSRELWEFGVQCREQRIKDWLLAAQDSDYQGIVGITQWLQRLAQLAKAEPAAVMVEHILGLRDSEGFTSPLKTHYLNQQSATYLETLSAIHKLRSLVTDFREGSQPQLEDFVQFLQLNRNHHVQITDESAFVSSEEAVELLSVHSAKGLEFDQVFIIDATDKTWSPGGARFRPPANLESMRPHGDDNDDYARLMFVALTRARSSIAVTSYQLDEHGKEVLPTALINHIETEEIPDRDQDVTQVAEQLLRWPVPPIRTQQQILLPLLESYSLPVTHLLNFIDVSGGGPAEFIERNVLRLPSVKTPHMAYGTAIHAALEFAQRETNRDAFDIERTLEVFQSTLRDEQLPSHDETKWADQGAGLLRNLLTNGPLVLKKGVQPERSLYDVRLPSGPILQGKLDAVMATKNEVRITDYKTGRGLRALDTYSQRDGVKALKHQLQLTFYALLARRSGIAKDNQQVVGEMVYVEADDARSFRVEYVPSSEDIEELEALITVVWNKIKNLDWPDVSNYDETRAGIEHFMKDLSNENR